jgi:D-hexose-6-phosphate mutarotase
MSNADPASPLEALIEGCDHLHHDAQGCGSQQGAGAAPMPLLRVRNGACEASIALQGAQLLSAVTDRGDLLWLSPEARFQPGEPIRGGVPVCLPWFGVNQRQPELPRHGFARVCPWDLVAAREIDADTTELAFALTTFAHQPGPLFPYRFSAGLTMRLGSRVALTLAVSNLDERAFPLSWALHSYHRVADSRRTRVLGLEGCDYLDNTRGLQPATQRGPVEFDGEVDRVFNAAPRRQIITGSPPLLIEGEGCPTAIVWNPGADGPADLGPEGYRDFVCVERGCAFAGELELAPGDTHLGRVAFAWADVGDEEE